MWKFKTLCTGNLFGCTIFLFYVLVEDKNISDVKISKNSLFSSLVSTLFPKDDSVETFTLFDKESDP